MQKKVNLSDFKDLNKAELIELVKNEAGESDSQSLLVVANRIFDIPEISCIIEIKADEDVTEYVKKWTKKFSQGFLNRPSQKTGNQMGTKHDAILDEIISARIGSTTEDLKAIKYAHRLSMSAENITGLLLEEYMADKLIDYNWHCCWGATMNKIDFCNENGRLLQIKNSSNTENSSSKTVREGTVIEHWFRRLAKKGTTNWDALNDLINITKESDKLSEDSFMFFVRNTVSNNPGLLFIESDNPWYATNTDD